MKRINFKNLLLYLFLIIYIISYNVINSLNINMNLYNDIMFVLLFFYSYIFLGFVKNKSITKKITIQYIFIYFICYIIVIYFLGIITGFYNNPLSLKFDMILRNLFTPVLLIVLKEFIRYIVIFKNRFNKKMIIMITIIFILLDIVILYGQYDLSTRYLILVFIGEAVIASIYNNILQTFLVYNNGVIPSIIYKILFSCYIYIVPIIPNLGDYLSLLLEMIFPVLLLLRINKLHYVYKNMNKKVNVISKKYISIPLVMILICFVSLISGIFKYQLLSVASDSMLPKISRGDAVLFEKIDDYKKLNVGDILVLDNEGTIFIHRIVEIKEKNDNVIITTKGDNNDEVDKFVTTDDEIVGRVKLNIKYLGYPSVWVNEAF